MFDKLKNKYQNLSPAVRAALWFTICNVIPQIVNIIMITIFTRILSTDDYGLSSNYTAWYGIVSIFITLNLNCGVYNNAMLKYENRRDEYDASMMGLSLFLGGVGLGVLLVFHEQFSRIMSLPFSMLLCLGLQCLLYNSYGCWISRVKYEYNYKSLVKITLLTSVLSPLLSIVFILFSTDKALGKVWGQNIIYLILGVVFYVIAIRKCGKIVDKEFWMYALKFNLPLIPHYLSLVVLNQSDRAMITAICGSTANALYSVAYSASSLLLILNAGISQAMTPWIYKKIKMNDLSDVKKTTTIICSVYVILDLLFILLAPEAISVLAGTKYAAAINILPPVATSMFFIFAYNLFSIVEFYYENTKAVMVCSSISALMNICLNYLFIPKYGYVAAAYTTLVSYFLNVSMHVVVIGALYRKHTRGKQIIDIPSVMTLGLCLIFFSITLTLLYDNTLLRWGIAGLAVLVLLLSYKRFVVIFEKLKRR